MEKKIRTMLRHNPAHQAGLCFLTACAGVFVYSLLNRHFLHAAFSLTLLVASLAAVRFISKDGGNPTSRKLSTLVREWRWHAALLLAVIGLAFNIYSLLTCQVQGTWGAIYAFTLLIMLARQLAVRHDRKRLTHRVAPPSRQPNTPILIFFFCILLALVPAKTVVAQSASPTPPILQPQPTPPFEAGNPNGQLTELLNHVRELVPYLRRQIERPMLQKFKTLAMILGSLVLLFSFIRVIRENDGASQELYYWGARAAIFMAFFALAPSIVSTLYKVGRTLTIPIESAIEDKRETFNKTYYDFVHGTYIVRDDKHIDLDPIYLKPGEDGWIGVLTDGEVTANGKMKGLEQLEKSTDLSSWNMDKLFFGLNVSRGILQAGEVFLLLLGGFVMIALRLAAPFMIAIAIDKKLAERITYPFVWGTIVFTLVFPVVRDVLTYIAYTVGCFGLMMYKGEAIYKIDDTTGNIVQGAAYYNPKMVILMSMVCMVICGLMLWLSPYLSYRIATGQVFEAVSSTASGWMAAMVGSAIEFAGLKAGASLQRQAENTQTGAGWAAEATRAKGTLDVSNLGAQARKLSGLASVEAGRTQAVAAVYGSAHQMIAGTNASTNFTIASTGGQVADSGRQTLIRANQSMNQADIQQTADNKRVDGDYSAAKWGAASTVATAIPHAGQIPAGQLQYYGADSRQYYQKDANRFTNSQTKVNEQNSAWGVVSSQERYGRDIARFANTQRDETIAGIKEGAGTQVAGANRAAGIASGGVNKAYGLEMQGNQIQYDTTLGAAGIIRDAGYRAAKMREVSTVISGMARDMDRRIEEGMRQRY